MTTIVNSEMDRILDMCLNENVQVSVLGDNLELSFDNEISEELMVLLKGAKEDLRQYLLSGSRPKTQSNELHIKPVASEEGLFKLSYSQERLWLLDRMEGGLANYNMAVALDVDGKLNKNIAEQAICEIIQRHEPLRTVFSENNGDPRQLVKDEFSFSITHYDFSNVAADLQTLRVDDLVESDMTTAFDLSSDLMVRVAYILLEETSSSQRGVLLFNVHHIASDGWSMGILIREFIDNYQAIQDSSPRVPSPTTIRYVDYAHWQRERRESGRLISQLNYWQETLAGVPPVHTLPLDYERPQVKSQRAGIVSSSLGIDLSDNLEFISRENKSTLFMVLHAALSLVLSKHSNNDDIVIGTPVANRQHLDLEPLIGFFVNTLVLRTQIENQSFLGYLDYVKRVNLGAQANQDILLEHLVDHLEIPQSLDFVRLTQIVFSMNTSEQMELSLPGVTFSNHESGGELGAKFDLEITAKRSKNGINISWIYDKSIFKADSIERLADHLLRTITAVVKDPDQNIYDIPMFSEKENRNLVHCIDDLKSQRSKSVCIHSVFELHAKNTPDHLAIAGDGYELTYCELNEAANSLARHLRENHIEKGALVGVMLPRSPDIVIAILAILKAGGVYVPLDSSYPKARLEFMLDDSSMSLVLIDSAFVNQLDFPSKVQKIEFRPTLEKCTNLLSKENIDLSSDPQTPAYVIYTSGSSGTPKGVMVSHANWYSFLTSVRDQYPIVRDERVLQFSATSFDIFIEELTLSIFNGGCLVFPGTGEFSSGAEFWRNVSENRISLVSLPTAYWHQLSIEENLISDANNSPLRLVIVGGEAIALNNVELWKKKIGNKIQLINTYGPTETTVVASVYDVTNSHSADRTVPIGSNLSNNYMMVMDSHQRVLPQGVVGELYIGGSACSLGYLNNPELTQQSFIQNPYSETKDVVYKTGDLVRRGEDGNFEFVGRVDAQIKIRGFRVELGEVENRLSQCRNVASSVVVTRADAAGGLSMVAYVVLQDFDEENEDAITRLIREDMKQDLPDYMQPNSYVILQAWPLTTGGKVDKKALPPPKRSMNIGHVAPTNQVEETLVSIWSSLLDLDSSVISVSESFFELGGHSLLVMKMVATIRERFSLELPVRDVFEYSDIRRLASRIEQISKEPLGFNIDICAVESSMDTFALSFAQQRLWFVDQLEEGSAQYNLPIVLKVDGEFCLETARKSITQIIDRHEPLRTLFEEDDNGPVQRIREEINFSLSSYDLCEMDSTAQDDQVRFLAREDSQKSFDLSKDLMVRASYIYLVRGANPKGILLFNIHHIASDGWSMGILIREFVENYQSALYGNENSLPPLSIRYVDYAHWQRQWLTGPLLQSQLDYWQGQLNELPTVHNMPLDFVRPEHKQHIGGVVSTRLSRDLTHQLKKIAKAHAVTPFMLLHGALALVLSRHSGSSDIVIGTPVANRVQSKLEPLIGFFANTLVLRTNTGYENLDEFLAHVRDTNIEAQAQQDIPFEYLVEKLRVERSTAHTPLFQILFAMNTNEGADLDLPDLKFSSVGSLDVVAKFDLEVNADIDKDGLFISWVYDTSIFCAKRVETYCAHLENLLNSIAAANTNRVPALEMLSKNEYHHLVYELNRTQLDVPEDLLIHEMLQAQAKASPHNIAVSFGNESMTYRELDEASNRMAHYLRSQGVGLETLVGICVERSIEMIVNIISILKSGGAYVPMDPTYPHSRLKFIVEDTALRYLLTDCSLVNELGLPLSINITNLKSENFKKSVGGHSRSALTPIDGHVSSSLAYVIYTSGSTGNPKGVMIEHGNTVSMLCWAQSQFDLPTLRRVLASTSICFDISIFEIFAPLVSGGCSVVVESIVTLQESGEDISLINTVPSAIHTLLECDAIPKSVTTINLAGELLEQSLVDRLYEKGVERVFDLYGPSEDTTYSTYMLRTKSGRNSIGRPIANEQAYILNADGAIVPKGVVGELFLAGNGIARGYLHRPDLTSERFIQNLFTDNSHGRLYKTGDLVRYLEDGNIEYIGRSDEQVKIRGFRIELGEIKNHLDASDYVSSSIVMMNETKEKQKYIVAYVIAKTEASPGLDDALLVASIKSELQLSIPSYMVPSEFVVLESWPLSSNGKIDKKKLPLFNSIANDDVYLAPATKTEGILVGIWSELLHLDLEKISVVSNFFELGGHSLMAVRFLSVLRKRLGVRISLKKVFEAPTIKSLSEYIDREGNYLDPSRDVIPVRHREMDIQASPQQKRLWLLEQLSVKNEGAYNICQGFILEGMLEVEYLEAAFFGVVERHEALKTNFIMQDGILIQKINKEADFAMEYADLSHLSETQLDLSLKEALTEQRTNQFDLSSDQMLRVCLFKISETKHVLLVNMHHIVADGWSLKILTEEFVSHYRALQSGVKAELPELSVQYADYSVWLNQHLGASSEIFRRMSSYWLDQLKGIPLCHDLPLDNPRPAIQTFLGRVHQSKIDAELTRKIKEFSRSRSVTLFMTMQAAFSVLLARYSGARDIVMGVPVANRDLPDVESLIGCFINTIVLRTKLIDGENFERVIAKAKENILSAFTHQSMPFELLVDAVQPDRSTSYSPIFQIMLVLHSEDDSLPEIPGLIISPKEDDHLSSKFDITLDIVETDNQLITQWEYNSEIFAKASIEHMSENFLKLLGGLMSNPQDSVDTISMLTSQEKKRTLFELNNTLTISENHRLCVHQLFEQKAEQTPNAVALIQDGISISYTELNCRANRVGRFLNEQGLSGGSKIGVLLEHSIDLVVSMLAIQKSGSSYLPLDTDAPPNRLLKILTISDVKCVLTSSAISTIELPNLIIIDIANIDTSKHADNNLDINIEPSDLVYSIFTSGSTGEPKGVEIEHSALTNFLLSMAKSPGINAGDKLLSVTHPTFDISGLEIFLPLINGATVVLGGAAASKDGRRLSHLLTKYDITIMQATPTMWRILLASGWSGKGNLKALTGGEAITEDLAAKLVTASSEVWNMYGPTETTIWSTCGQIERDVEHPERVNITIGKPIDNTQIYILDKSLDPVPVGVPGEIYIGGLGLARGYSGQPMLTKSVFVDNPYADHFGSSRLYKTGDLAKFTLSGGVCHLGRLDHQIKRNGFRIEPMEIESVLNQHDMIVDSLVVTHTEVDGDRSDLIAYYTSLASEKDKVKISELRNYLSEFLPQYMVPSRFIHIDRFPVTTSGKKDRANLPKPEFDRDLIKSQFVAPSNSLEDFIIGILINVLGIQDVGVEDNFFEIGATSMDVVNLSNALSGELGFSVSAVDIFTYTTTQTLANYLNTQEREFQKPNSRKTQLSRAKDRLKARAKRVKK